MCSANKQILGSKDLTLGPIGRDSWRALGVGTVLIRSAVDLARRKEYRRLEIETLAENAPMRQLAVKAGFNLESVRKNRVLKNGSYFDEVVYFLLL